jgi:hypothetical protein
MEMRARTVLGRDIRLKYARKVGLPSLIILIALIRQNQNGAAAATAPF